MTNQPPGDRSFAPEVFRLVDGLCAEFEAAWKSGQRPKLSQFVADVREPIRCYLLRELVLLDVEYREKHGETPSLHDYAGQFPDDVSILRAVWACHVQQGEVETADACHAGQDASAPAASAGSRHAAQVSLPAEPLDTIGDYELLQEIGRGGMGVVYQARQISLNRTVALKMIGSGQLASAEEILRFRTEAEAAASLDHPGIVPIYAVSEEGGRHYYSMAYVAGENLGRRLEPGPLPPAEGAELVQKIARAVHFAHTQGVIHRDLKPANILLDGDNEPRITDFGLAKRLTGGDGPTVAGQVLGTPSYMSPEQASGDGREIGPETDIYSLGAILYGLLVGRPPFSAANVAETLRLVSENDPVPPRQHNPAIHRDLQTICLKCLQKKPRERYATASELADELDRYRKGEPIKARPPGRVELLGRWCAHNKRVAALLAFVLLLVVFLAAGGGAFVQVWLTQEGRLLTEARQRRRAEVLNTRFHLRDAQVALALGDTQRADQSLENITPAQGDFEYELLRAQLQPTLRPAAILVEGNWAPMDAVLLGTDGRLAVVDAGGQLLVWNLNTARLEALLASGRWSEEKARGLYHFESRKPGSDLLTWEACYAALAALPDTSQAVAVSLDGSCVVFGTAAGSLRSLSKLPDPLYAVAAGRDGQRILCGGRSGKLYLISVTDGKVLRTESGPAAVTHIAAMPGGDGWVVGRADGQLEQRAPDDLAWRWKSAVVGPVWAIDVKREETGTELAVACAERRIRRFRRLDRTGEWLPSADLLAPETREEVQAYHQVRYSQNQQLVYAIDNLGRLCCWHCSTAKCQSRQAVLRLHPARKVLLSLVREGTPDERLPPSFLRAAGVLIERPGAQQLVTGGDDAILTIWKRTSGTDVRAALRSKAGLQPRIRFDPTHANLLWALSQDGGLQVIDVEQDRIVHRTTAHQVPSPWIADLQVIAKNGPLLSVGGDQFVRFWHFDGQRIQPAETEPLQHDRPLVSIAVSPDGGLIAAVDDTSRLVGWARGTGRQVFLTTLSKDSESSGNDPLRSAFTGRLAFNCDGTRLCAFGAGQAAPVFDTAPFRGPVDHIWVAGTRGGTALAWSPLSPDVLLAADDSPRCTVRVFGRRVEGIGPPATRTTCAAMAATPNARRIALLEEAGRVVFLDAEFMIEMLELQSHLESASDLAFDGTEHRLAIAGKDGTIEVWDTRAPPPPIPVVEATDVTASWSSQVLVPPTGTAIHLEPRMVTIDVHDRVNALYVESLDSAFRGEGALHFVREDLGFAARERLEAKGNAMDWRATRDAAVLQCGPNGEPVAVFRLRTALETGYDGEILTGSRQGSKRWTFQTIHASGNWGFFPVMHLAEEGTLKEVAHFSSSQYHLVLSSPSAAAGEWSFRILGRQGDGMGMEGVWDRNGQLHVTFHPNRFNSDPALPMFANWDGVTFRREMIDPWQDLALYQAQLDAEARPHVLVGDRIMRRIAGRWEEFAKLPSAAHDRFAIAPNEDIWTANWDAAGGRMLLWQGTKGKWSAQTIATTWPYGAPTWWTVQIAPSGRPVVLAGVVNRVAPGGWFCVLRPKK